MPEEQNKNESAGHNKTLLSWESPEFIHYERGWVWYLVMGTFGILMILYALYTQAITMAIVFILLIGSYAMVYNQKPKMLHTELTELGIQYGKTFYPYNTVNAFWVVYEQNMVNRLYLRFGKKNYKHVSIELYDQDPVAVRKIIGKEVPEFEGGIELMSDVFIRLFRLH